MGWTKDKGVCISKLHHHIIPLHFLVSAHVYLHLLVGEVGMSMNVIQIHMKHIVALTKPVARLESLIHTYSSSRIYRSLYIKKKT